MEELTEDNPFARLVIKREDNNKVLFDSLIQFDYWGSYVQASWDDAGEKQLTKSKK